MERVMILLVVVAVSLSAELSCPPDKAALVKEVLMCLDAKLEAAGLTTADLQGRAGQCLAVPHLLKCIDTALTGCEGVEYVEAMRAEIDAEIQDLNRVYQQGCV